MSLPACVDCGNPSHGSLCSACLARQPRVSARCARCGAAGELVHGGGESALGRWSLSLLCDTCADQLMGDQPIRRLRAEAAEAGDIEQVALCDRAMGEFPDDDYSGGGLRRDDYRRIRDMPEAEARRTCIRALLGGQA